MRICTCGSRGSVQLAEGNSTGECWWWQNGSVGICSCTLFNPALAVTFNRPCPALFCSGLRHESLSHATLMFWLVSDGGVLMPDERSNGQSLHIPAKGEVDYIVSLQSKQVVKKICAHVCRCTCLFPWHCDNFIISPYYLISTMLICWWYCKVLPRPVHSFLLESWDLCQ